MGTPCVNVPGLADSGGLPLGVQVIGRFGGDRTTLEAARFVEVALVGAVDCKAHGPSLTR
jgi:Asp-tRNA(Asn)/Glu-tRNA(Gln) amidotransferase A subunit family amidase